MHLPQMLSSPDEASEVRARLAAIVDSSFDAILSKELDGTLTSWNRAAERLYGYSAAEAVGRHISLIVPPERRAELDGIMHRIRLGEPLEPFETVRVRKDGTRLDIFLTVSPIRDGTGRVIGASAIARDVTERKRAREELTRSREHLRDFLENAVLGLHWVGPDGTILWANRAELQMLGYTEEEYVGRSIAEFHVEQETICDILQRLSQNEALHNYEARLRAKDGSIRHVLISSNVYRENDEFVHTRCFTRDVTDLKLAEMGLRDSEARFRAVVETAAAGIVNIDETGTITFVNPAVEAMFGYRREELTGRNVRMLMPGEHQARHDGYLRNYLETGEAKIIGVGREVSGVRKDGSFVPLFLAVSEFSLAGKRHFAGILRDISEAKAGERQRELLIRELDHRVKNSLAIVQSVCQQTLRSAESLTEFGDCFGGRLQAIARTHALLAAYNWSQTELSELIETIVEPYRDSGGVELRPGPPLLLKSSAALHIGMALNELMTNSAKYGALSAAAGRIDLGWQVNGSGELQLTWSERGGPPVSPPERRGFGTALIEKGTELQFGGRARIVFDAAGLTCEIVLPRSALVEPDETAAPPSEVPVT
ncbi:MAG TPA: PAS domain S-box protein [Afifellaceae bacterium]|nr:PAS domain S-box protein [Afifellaceae bacterium]